MPPQFLDLEPRPDQTPRFAADERSPLRYASRLMHPLIQSHTHIHTAASTHLKWLKLSIFSDVFVMALRHDTVKLERSFGAPFL